MLFAIGPTGSLALKHTTLLYSTMPQWNELTPTDIKLGEWKGRLQTIQEPNRFQIPLSRAPFGVSVFNDKKDIQLECTDSTWYDWVRALEANIMTQIVDKSTEIFSMSKTIDEVGAMWNSNLRDTKLRIKLDTCSFWDKDGKRLSPPDDIAGWLGRASVNALVQVDSVYFFNGKCGLVWKGLQLKVEEMGVPKEPAFPQGECLL